MVIVVVSHKYPGYYFRLDPVNCELFFESARAYTGIYEHGTITAAPFVE